MTGKIRQTVIVAIASLLPVTVGHTTGTSGIKVYVTAAEIEAAQDGQRGQQAPPEKATLTNSDVLSMVKAELAESTIILAIQQAVTNFDTSPPQALITLKNQGVSAKILDAMLGARTSDKPETAILANSDSAAAQVQQAPKLSGTVADQTNPDGQFNEKVATLCDEHKDWTLGQSMRAARSDEELKAEEEVSKHPKKEAEFTDFFVVSSSTDVHGCWMVLKDDTRAYYVKGLGLIHCWTLVSGTTVRGKLMKHGVIQVFFNDPSGKEEKASYEILRTDL